MLLAPVAKAQDNSQSLKIINLSNATLALNCTELHAMPKTTVNANLSCYGLLVADGEWGGIKLLSLLNQAGLDPTVASVYFVATDGYAVSIPIGTALRDDVIVAYELNGEPLSEGLRLVIPDSNGNIWISMITSITMDLATINQASSLDAQVTMPEYKTSPNPTESPTQQATPQPTASTSAATVEPTAASTNVTERQSNQKASMPSTGPVFFVAVGLVVAIVAASFVLYRFKKSQS